MSIIYPTVPACVPGYRVALLPRLGSDPFDPSPEEILRNAGGEDIALEALTLATLGEGRCDIHILASGTIELILPMGMRLDAEMADGTPAHGWRVEPSCAPTMALRAAWLFRWLEEPMYCACPPWCPCLEGLDIYEIPDHCLDEALNLAEVD